MQGPSSLGIIGIWVLLTGPKETGPKKMSKYRLGRGWPRQTWVKRSSFCIINSFKGFLAISLFGPQFEPGSGPVPTLLAPRVGERCWVSQEPFPASPKFPGSELDLPRGWGGGSLSDARPSCPAPANLSSLQGLRFVGITCEDHPRKTFRVLPGRLSGSPALHNRFAEANVGVPVYWERQFYSVLSVGGAPQETIFMSCMCRTHGSKKNFFWTHMRC